MSDSSNLGSGWPTETQRLLVPAAVVPDPALHQTLVWDRIDALEREVLTLKSYHNTLALPSRLPPEVLCDIFLAAGVGPERSDQARRVAWNDSGERLWIVVTHVCKSWRETALGCPALWANLTFISPSFTRVMLQRSRNAPLTIDYSGKFQHEDLLAEAISHTERLRSVKIGIPNNTSLPFEYALSGFSSGVEATILETLSLESVSRNGLLPARFLHGGAPSLKLLSLKGCHIPDWKALPLGPNLTTLTILPCKAVVNTTKYRPSALDFYRSLNRIPQLQSLDLRGFLPLDTCGSNSIITFSALQTLTLHDMVGSIGQFFHHIKIPETTILELEPVHTGLAGEYNIMMSNLSACWMSGMRRGVQVLAIVEGCSQKARFRASFSRDKVVNLNLASRHSSLTTLQCLVSLNRILDLSALVEVRVAGTASLVMSVSEWEALSCLPNVELVEIVASEVDNFIRALNSTDAKFGTTSQVVLIGRCSATRPPLFPALTHINFSYIKQGGLVNIFPELARGLRLLTDTRPALRLEVHANPSVDDRVPWSTLPSVVAKLEVVKDGQVYSSPEGVGKGSE